VFPWPRLRDLERNPTYKRRRAATPSTIHGASTSRSRQGAAGFSGTADSTLKSAPKAARRLEKEPSAQQQTATMKGMGHGPTQRGAHKTAFRVRPKRTRPSDTILGERTSGFRQAFTHGAMRRFKLRIAGVDVNMTDKTLDAMERHSRRRPGRRTTDGRHEWGDIDQETIRLKVFFNGPRRQNCRTGRPRSSNMTGSFTPSSCAGGRTR